MNILEKVRKKSKATTAAAVGGFVLSNPMIATFLLGAGLAVWWALRSRGRGF